MEGGGGGEKRKEGGGGDGGQKSNLSFKLADVKVSLSIVLESGVNDKNTPQRDIGQRTMIDLFSCGLDDFKIVFN